MATDVSGRFVKNSINMKLWKGPVIDLGSGGYSNYYKPHFGTEKYVRLDLEAQPNNGTDIIADILDMPQIPSDNYGVVLLCETLEHVNNPFKAFKEAARILRPGGLFICTTVACWTEHKHPKDYWRFLPDGLRYLCETVGLNIYNLEMFPNDAQSPAHCSVAAIK